jgi:hypothetical protein
MKKQDTQEEVRINVRTRPDVKRDLEIAARLNGITMSALVNNLVVKKIREEKERSPEEFEKFSEVAVRKSGIAEPISPEETVPVWQKGLRRAKGMWEGRDDLPDVRQLREEADRSARWDKI